MVLLVSYKKLSFLVYILLQSTFTSTCITRLSIKDGHNRASFNSSPNNKRDQLKRTPTMPTYSSGKQSIPISHTPRLSIPGKHRQSLSQTSSFTPSDYFSSNSNSMRKDSNVSKLLTLRLLL